MTSATLKMYGDIGESIPESVFTEGVQNISSKFVSEFLESNSTADEIVVRINSRGGDVQEGWAIHDLLVSSGKKIKTIGEGRIYSIATIIFLAGAEREIMQNADGLIHNPFIPQYTLADKYESDDLTKIAQALKQEEEKILEFYALRTGSPIDKLAGYMKEDTKLSAKDMLDLGFATKIIEPVKAYAYLKPIINITMTDTDVKTFGEKLDAIIAKIANFSRISTKDQTFTDQDGKEFKIVKEEGSPSVGDEASPDGTFTMADGKTVVISGGKITEVKQPAEAKTELQIAQDKIAELEAKVSAAEAEKEKAVAAEASFRNSETEAKALVAELSQMKNTWKPAARSLGNRVDNAGKVGNVDLARVKELNEKINNAKTE